MPPSSSSGTPWVVGAVGAQFRRLRRQSIAVPIILVALWCTSASAQTAAPKPPSLGAVFSEVPGDLWHFISWDTALVLGIGGGAAAVGHIWDDDLAQEIETNPALNDAMAPGNTYGAFSTQVILGVGMYAGGWFAKQDRLARAGADIMRAQLLSQIYVQAIKYSAQRERPDKSDSLSFPSGHSASAFATAGVLQRHYGWRVGVPAFAVAGYVATARVHDNRHYLSDVIFGGAMGIASERTVSLHSGRYGIQIAPTGGSGSVGVVVGVQPR